MEKSVAEMFIEFDKQLEEMNSSLKELESSRDTIINNINSRHDVMQKELADSLSKINANLNADSDSHAKIDKMLEEIHASLNNL